MSRFAASGDGKVVARKERALMSVKNFIELIPLDIDLETTRQLVLKGKNITAIPLNIGTLLREVRRLDLSTNDVRDITPLATLANLTSINLTRNPHLLSIAPLASLHLIVVVVAHCGLRSLVGLEGSAETLKTLVVNDNNLLLRSPSGKCVEGAGADEIATAVKNYEVIADLTECETLVLSRNPLLCSLYAGPTEEDKTHPQKKAEAGEETKCEPDWEHPLSAIVKMTCLKKLSLSGCGLTSLPRHWFIPKVTELRLSQNKLKSLVPEGVLFRSVKILDVSHNELKEASTLRRCRFVYHLGVRGNPFVEDGNVSTGVKRKAGKGDDDDKSESPPPAKKNLGAVLQYLMRIMPHLEMVDGTPLAQLLPTEQDDERKETVEFTANKQEESAESVADDGGSKVPKEEDNALEPPETSELGKPAIVRRGQTNLLATKKRRLSAEGAAVTQLLLKRKTEASGW